MGIAIKGKCAKKSDEISLPNPTSRAHSNAFGIWAVQCATCFNWRTIASVEEYEKHRSNWSEDPFVCSKKPNVSCNDPSDIECVPTEEWAIDCPDVPKTPAGFEREYVQRRDQSKYDVYYIAPTGKKLRTLADVTSFLNENPEFSDLSVSDFSFAGPVIERPRPRPVRRRRARRTRRQG